jgi:chromosome segregation ATPase
MKESEELSAQLLRSEEERSEAMLHLKTQNAQLAEMAGEQEQKIRGQDKTLNEQNRKLNHLIKECEEACKQKGEAEANLRKTVRALEDLRVEHSELLTELQLISKAADNQLLSHGEQVGQLSE